MSPKFSTTSEWIEQASQYVISQITRDADRLRFDPVRYPDEVTAIFMAGAPGSGKTEFIESVLKYFDFFFIDIDSYRGLFEWYHWDNAREYQEAMTKVVNKVMEYCMENKIRFILDGTFKSGRHSLGNIRECKKRGRKADIYFIYQNPYISYLYTFLREINEERNIEVPAFVDCFYKSINNVYIAYKDYKSIVNLYVVEKDSGMPFMNKGYIIHDIQDINTIEKFCNKFRIRYNRDTGEFINRNIFERELLSDRKILNFIKPVLKNYYFLISKLWLRKQKTSSKKE